MYWCWLCISNPEDYSTLSTIDFPGRWSVFLVTLGPLPEPLVRVLTPGPDRPGPEAGPRRLLAVGLLFSSFVVLHGVISFIQ